MNNDQTAALLVFCAPLPGHHELTAPDAARCLRANSEASRTASHLQSRYGTAQPRPASKVARSSPPTLHLASQRLYRSFLVVSQLTGRAPIQSARARAACWPQRHSEPSGRMQGWRFGRVDIEDADALAVDFERVRVNDAGPAVVGQFD